MGMHVWYHFSDYGYKVNILFFRSNINYKGKWKLLLWEKDFAKFKGTRVWGRLCSFSLWLFGIWGPWTPCCLCPVMLVDLTWGLSVKSIWVMQTACPPLRYSLISRANIDKITVVEKSELDYLLILRCHLKFFNIFGKSLD